MASSNESASIPGNFSFFVMTGTYSSIGNGDEVLIEQLRHISPGKSNAQLILHLGDVLSPPSSLSSLSAMSSSSSTKTCDEMDYWIVQQTLIKNSPLPIFMTMGDNEWTDCPDPDRAYGNWINYFGTIDKHWSHNFRVARQGGDDQDNFAIYTNGILFVGVNTAGNGISAMSATGTENESTARKKEWQWRLRSQRDYSWVESRLADAVAIHGNDLTTVVVATHTGVLYNGVRGGQAKDSLFENISHLMEQKYPHITLLYLHRGVGGGDGGYSVEQVSANVWDVRIESGYRNGSDVITYVPVLVTVLQGDLMNAYQQASFTIGSSGDP